MNKADLVAKISGDNEMTKADAERVLNSMLEGIGDALKNDGSVTLVGFGTFSVSERAARKGRNPQTGEEMHIPAKKVVKFKPGKSLKESL